MPTSKTEEEKIEKNYKTPVKTALKAWNSNLESNLTFMVKICPFQKIFPEVTLHD